MGGTRYGRPENGARMTAVEGQDAQTPQPAISTGDKVRHKMFGEGMVISSKPSGDDVEVTVAFTEDKGVKRLLLGIAPLEKVE